MRITIKQELLGRILDRLNDGSLTDNSTCEAHYYCFNESYYIIGYYQAEEWLKRHGVSPFEAIGVIQEYENDNFGEVTTKLDNAESIVNMYVYILGEELIGELDTISDNWSEPLTEELAEQLREELESLID